MPKNSNTDPKPQCVQTDVSDSFLDWDDDFIDWWIDNEPELTEEEQKQKMIDLDKCCDFILKNKITPNMDGIY